MVIPVYKPTATEEDIRSVINVLRSDYWGSGPETELFEQEFSKYLSVKHCVAVNSCTSALILAGKILDLKPGSEILIPAITWVSSAFLAEHNNYKSVFVDVEDEYLNIDVKDIKRKINSNTKAIVLVHHSGNACNIKEILAVAKESKLFVIEDCAHSLGASYDMQKLGTFGDLSCFSFQAVKNITTGEGGMISTNIDKFAERLKSLRWLGIDVDPYKRMNGSRYTWHHDIKELGYKFQMSDILAALGRSQLKRLDLMNNNRKTLANNYNQYLSSKFRTPLFTGGSSYHLYVLRSKHRDRIMSYLNDRGIHSSVHYKPLYHYSIFKNHDICPTAEKIWPNIFSIPLYAGLTQEEQHHVINTLCSFN